MAVLNFKAAGYASQRAAELLAEGEPSVAIAILKSQRGDNAPLFLMLAEMLSSNGNAVGTGLKVVRTKGKGRITKTHTNFWRNHILGQEVDSLMSAPGMSVRTACKIVAGQLGVSVDERTISTAYQSYKRYLLSISDD